MKRISLLVGALLALVVAPMGGTERLGSARQPISIPAPAVVSPRHRLGETDDTNERSRSSEGHPGTRRLRLQESLPGRRFCTTVCKHTVIGHTYAAATNPTSITNQFSALHPMGSAREVRVAAGAGTARLTWFGHATAAALPSTESDRSGRHSLTQNRSRTADGRAGIEVRARRARHAS